MSTKDSKQSKSKSEIAGELAIKITAGDRIAKNEFVKENYQWLLFIVRRKFSKSNNHEDIVQDTLMLVIANLEMNKIKKPMAIVSYLRSTAINIGFQYLRNDKKFESSINHEFIDAIEDAKEGVLSTIIWQDKINYVKQIMDELSIERDKAILTKFYFNDESKALICKELDLTSIHFDRVLYRAKERLKQLVGIAPTPHGEE